MSDGKSFWSSVPGAVTGVAGVITAIVGLLGVSVQLGWLGGDGKETVSSSADGTPTTTVSTVAGARTTIASSSSPAAAATHAGEFEVEPPSITFEPLKPREDTVVVRNTGDVALTMRAPTVSGSGATSFKSTDVSCAGSTLAPGRSCEVKVTFAPPQPGEFIAVLVVAATNAPRQVEVDLKGTASLLG